MAALREKVLAGMAEEERLDVLFQLLCLIEDGRAIGNTPEEIQLEEDNRVKITRRTGAANLAFWPPEVIRAAREGRTLSTGKEQAWYLLGMLAYFVYHQTDYYTQRGLFALDLDAYTAGRRSVIQPEEAAKMPPALAEAVSCLTAVEPGGRVRGVAKLVNYLGREAPGTAEIRFIRDGKTAAVRHITLTRDLEDLTPGGTVELDGVSCAVESPQPVRIPYRPGSHVYQVVLKGRDSAAAAQPEGRWLYVTEDCLTGRPGPGARPILALNERDAALRLPLQLSPAGVQFTIGRAGAAPRYSFHASPPPEAADVPCLAAMSYTAAEGVLKVQLLTGDGAPLTPLRTIALGAGA